HTTAENNWERDTDKYYFMLPKLADNLKIGSTDNFPKHTLKIKTITRNGRRLHFLLGQTPADSELYSERPKSHYIRGRMRDLNPQGDDDDFYRQHKYERFIPQPEAGSDHPLPREIHIPDEVINRYKRIAAHAKKLDDNYPLTPTGYPKLEIEDGMLMFFDINKDKYEKDGKLEVSELSHSSIWRQEFPHKDTESAIKALKESKNMLPWSSDRTHLTPAEQILGVAAEQTEETEDNKVSMLKGRIRFTDAKPLEQTGIERLPAQTLKILASPKPPSRYFYFHKTNKRSGNDDDRETNDRKHDLDINGRKYYLHQQEETVESTKSENKLRWWETKDTENISGTIHQKISCCPVDENQKFHFDIHFNNLSDAELGLLLTALNPGDGFVHRLGLGKPLGLGSVSIFIGRLEVLNARESYTGWSDTAIHQNKKECMEEFKKATQDTGWIDDCVLSVLKELGNPNKVTELVTYPVSHKQYDEAEKPEGEQELFQWFVENKKKGNNAQWLMKERLKDSCGSFSVFGTLLETLDADEKQKKRGKAQ
ncbi:MAG TPA: TIGR03986 family CRISPR-associated RAMP protein, partial [Gammaproteobacteria bacterium]|nr:TIGR03986 family CRISPR-associated RAMP protein [Gammaproteobacteria bacterium]